MLKDSEEANERPTLKEMEQKQREAVKVKMEAISVTPLSVAPPNVPLTILTSTPPLVSTFIPLMTSMMTPPISNSAKTPKSGSSKGGSSGITPSNGRERKSKEKETGGSEDPKEGRELRSKKIRDKPSKKWSRFAFDLGPV